ncbi:MAG: hypothetical protein WA921_05130 [Ahrensia sp.]
MEEYQTLSVEGKTAARFASLDNVARASGIEFVGTAEAPSDDKQPQSVAVKQPVMRGKVKSASATGVLTIAVEKLIGVSRPISQSKIQKLISSGAHYKKLKVGERVIIQADTMEADANQDLDISSKHG